ncbi:uncharacterized protein LOC112454039 isoform X2 [Temnothorax curvispinosus]|uniref:Uncharacterized protein LOC112454039 isoform X2 n=1 Tax=Temnothorax curvispinosus TaxID=300111 RepID=A0A6J1PPH2_9HYME|nr:uncharacterized protein LOC112454039 isoform X2 [Temnothorax curvispinosus]
MRKRKYFTKKWICSKHFADEAFTKPLQEHLLGYSPIRTRKIHPDAIPTLHLHAVPPLTSNENVLAETMPLPVSNEVSMDVEQTPASSSIEEQTPASSSTEEQTAASSSTEEQTPASSSTEAIMLQIRRLEAQVAALKKDDKELMEQKMTELLGKMFSPGQIRMILNPSLRKIKWSSEDIARAISLRCVSPKAYRYMKNVLQMPLPGLSTLRRQIERIDLCISS